MNATVSMFVDILINPLSIPAHSESSAAGRLDPNLRRYAYSMHSVEANSSRTRGCPASVRAGPLPRPPCVEYASEALAW